MNGRHSILRVSAVVVLLLLAGCFGDETPEAPEKTTEPASSVGWVEAPAEEVADGGVLRIAIDGIPANFNPEHASNVNHDLTMLLSPTVGSPVRILQDGSWEVDPLYARSVTIVERDPLQVRVQLNRDAVWQGGSPITVDDMTAYVDAHDGSDDDFEVASTRGWDNISAVTPGSDEFEYTVSFDEPIADWPRFIYPGLPMAVSSSPEKFNQRYTERSIPSNGPFIVESVDRDRGRVVMEPNHRWWGEQPKLDRVVWQVAEPSVRAAAIDSGELDVAAVAPEMFGDLRPVDDARIQVAAGTDWTQLTMNGARGPLASVDVRRAVAAALDRERIAKLSNRGVPAAAEVPGSFVLVSGQAGYRDQSDRIEYDVRAAAELLDEAGWKLPADATVRERKGKPLVLEMPVPTSTPTIEARAAEIADQLARVGIQVDLQPVEADDYYSSRIVPLDFDLATFTHAGSPFPIVDAEALFHPLDSGQNFTGLDDQKLADLWRDATTALSDEARFDAVHKVDRRLFGDVPILPLGMVPHVALVRDGVVNIGASQFRTPDWTVVGHYADDSEENS